MYQTSKKDEFLSKLKEKIKKQLSNIKVINIKEENKTKYIIELPFETKNRVQIRQLLLLFNVEYIVKQYIKVKEEENSELFIRFPFELFKKESWDIEHIDSYTENEITDYSTQIEWLKNAKIDLADEIDKEVGLKIDKFIDNKKSGIQFIELKLAIMKMAGENENNDDEKNSFGNLTLLDAKTNRSYGNALFSTKRKKIIERETNGKFIPVCTKNVFLKYFDTEGSSRTRWTSTDIDKYQNHVVCILKDFLTFK